MIDVHITVIRYKIEHGRSYIIKYVNNATSLQMVRISLIDTKFDKQNNGRNIIFFWSSLENCLILMR